MSPSDKSLERLLAAARRAPTGDESAPFGFATRVAARAFDAPQRGSLSARAALQALAVSGILAAIAVAANFNAIVTAFDDEPQVAVTEDPVAEVVNIGS
jgi:hypothetical protein